MITSRILLTASLLTWVGALRADAPTIKPITVPFELLPSRHVAVLILVNGKGPYRVIFDTGAPITVLSNKVARESGLLAKGERPPAFTLFGGGGQVQAKTLEVGGVKAEKVPVIVMDHPTIELAAKAMGPLEGIVGFPFFARYRITIDYQAKQLTFVPNGYQPPDVLQALMASLLAPAASDRPVVAPAAQWGLVVAKAVDDAGAGVMVQAVLPGGAAAAAGLRAGDRLLTLDGRWTDSVTDTCRAAGDVAAGAAVKVVVRRDGRELELRVRPRRGL